MSIRKHRAGKAFAWMALGLGLGHAAFSFYWAVGGTWLLDTVGQWAVEAQRETPGLALAVLLSITAVKVAAAIVPVAAEYRKLNHRRFWRAICWIGGLRIAIYGAFNTVVALAVLARVIQPVGGYDTRSMIGHAFIWGPWFFLWGAALVTSLIFTRGVQPDRRLNHSSRRLANHRAIYQLGKSSDSQSQPCGSDECQE